MRSLWRMLVVIGSAAALVVALVGPGRAAGPSHPNRHVLLISIDGLHQSDLAWWVSTHPSSNLADLVHSGVEYTNAHTPVPSDSFPGLIAQITGGNPATTGIYYDVEYNRSLLAPGSSCTPGQTTGLGTVVAYDESIDANPDSIDAGDGIPNLYPGLPTSVLALPGDLPSIEQHMIDSTQLPIDPATCSVVWPHQYIKVNTVFDVAHDAGLRTAWSDKHPAY
jgi:type I phosphodiesterase/nucleotide pyrophosphatase